MGALLNNMKYNVNLLHGVAWSTVGKVAQVLLGFITLAAFARFLGPEAFGVVAMAWVAVGVVELITGGMLAESLIQQKDLRPAHTNTTFWLLLGFGFISFVVISTFSDGIAALVGGPAEVATVLGWRAISLPLGAVSGVHRALLRREGRFKAVATVETFGSMIASVLGISLAVSGAGIWSIIVNEVARVGFTMLGAMIATRWRPGFEIERKAFMELLNFNIGSLAGVAMLYIDRMIPRLVIGNYLGASAVGIYTMAERLLEQIGDILIGPAWDVTLVMSARSQGQPEALRKLMRQTILATALVVIPLYLALVVLAPTLIDLVFGARWAGAATVVQLFLLGGLLLPASELGVAMLRGVGRSTLAIMLMVADVVVQAAMVFAVVGWGLEAVAGVRVAKELILWPAGAVVLASVVGMSVRVQATAAFTPLLAGAPMAAVVWSVHHLLAPVWPQYLAAAVALLAGAVTYPCMLRWLAPTSFESAVSAVRSALRTRGSH